MTWRSVLTIRQRENAYSPDTSGAGLLPTARPSRADDLLLRWKYIVEEQDGAGADRWMRLPTDEDICANGLY